MRRPERGAVKRGDVETEPDDLSLGGARVEFDVALEIGASGQLQLGELNLPFRVVGHAGTHSRLRFVELDAATRERLGRILRPMADAA